MTNLYLSFFEDDCSHFAQAMGQRFQSMNASYRVLWPIPATPLPAMRNTVLQSVDFFIGVLGPSWEHLKHDDGHTKLAHPDDPMRYDLEFALTHRRPMLLILYKRVHLPEAHHLPGALRALRTMPSLKIEETMDMAAIAIRLNMKLSHVVSAA